MANRIKSGDNSVYEIVKEIIEERTLTDVSNEIDDAQAQIDKWTKEKDRLQALKDEMISAGIKS